MLEGFTAGLLLITVSELGDKTFFIAVVLAMRHPRSIVLTGAISALAAMTLLSVLLGRMVMFLPPAIARWGEVMLLAGFGLTMLWQSRTIPDRACQMELGAATEEVLEGERRFGRFGQHWGTLLESFSLIFLAEWGDRTQFATITLAAGNDPVGVSAGAIVGHALCAVIAITSGCLLADRLSERALAQIGGMLFLIFAAVAWFGTQ